MAAYDLSGAAVVDPVADATKKVGEAKGLVDASWKRVTIGDDIEEIQARAQAFARLSAAFAGGGLDAVIATAQAMKGKPSNTGSPAKDGAPTSDTPRGRRDRVTPAEPTKTVERNRGRRGRR